MDTGPITSQGPIAGDDDVVDAWIYAADDPRALDERGYLHNKITVSVSHGGPDDGHAFHFALHPEQADALGQRLLALAYEADSIQHMTRSRSSLPHLH